MFSLEAVSSYFPQKTMWRTFFCAIVSTLFIRYVNPFSTGKMVRFQVWAANVGRIVCRTLDEPRLLQVNSQFVWIWFELVPFALLGVIGGLVGALFIRTNMRLRAFRKSKPWLQVWHLPQHWLSTPLLHSTPRHSS